jgi:FkbM family methyltransferase
MYLYSSHDKNFDKPRYSWEAFVSAFSVRQHSDAPIRLVTNNHRIAQSFEANPINPFTDIVVKDKTHSAKAQKISAMRDHGFVETIFLDTHTLVFSDLSPIFDIQSFQIAGVRPPWRVNTSDKAIDPRAEKQYQFSLNTGVLFIRGPTLADFFDHWGSKYMELLARYGDKAQDQPAFTAAAADYDLDILTLPENFNFRGHLGGRVSGKCHVYHSHLWTDTSRLAALNFDLQSLSLFLSDMTKTLNAPIENRVFVPCKQQNQVDISTIHSALPTDKMWPGEPLTTDAGIADRLRKADELGLFDLKRVNAVVDIGVGHTGTGFLVKCFPGIPFICIEPNRELRGKIERHYPSRMTQFFYIAVGRTTETRIFYPGGDDPNKGGLFSANEWSPKGAGEGTPVEVQVKPLDALKDDFSFPGPYFVKIDAEGAELDILEGAMQLLDDVEALFVEVAFVKRYQDSYSFNELISFLHERGFASADIGYMPPRGLRAMPIRRLDMLFTRANGGVPK